MRERPPAPRERLEAASDLRLDSLGLLTGTLVGEGTGRATHLVATDSVVLEALIRRYAPAARRTTRFWDGLKPGAVVRLPIRGAVAGESTGVLVRDVAVSSANGVGRVVPIALSVRTGRCGGQGSQLELVAEPAAGSASVGPVLASLATPRTGTGAREPIGMPDSALTARLLSRTRAAVDSVILAREALKLEPGPDLPATVNTLDDFAAADIMPYHAGSGRIRYAVSTRDVRRAGNDTLVLAGVMAWDSAGSWQQHIVRPTVVRLRRGRAEPFRSWLPLYWRRLAALADFGFDRDNLWMEQVSVRDGAVLWAVVQPADNVVVAAALMQGPCSP